MCDIGYENGTGEWDEYPPYLNSEGLEITSPVSAFTFSFTYKCHGFFGLLIVMFYNI